LLAVPFAAWLRYEFDLASLNWLPLIGLAFATVLLQAASGWALGLYRGRHHEGSFDEVRLLTLIVVVVGVLATVGAILFFELGEAVPRSTAMIATPFALVSMFALRYFYRMDREAKEGPDRSWDREKTIVYGAGYLGETLVRRMTTDSASQMKPVALMDDSPAMGSRVIRGVRVLGGFDDLESIVERTGATQLVLAFANPDSDRVREISDRAAELGLSTRILPPLDDLISGKTKLSDLRKISIEDLIGRHPVDTEVDSVADYIAGKRVLITGAGGSIGSELCREVLKYAPLELIMLDRDESLLQSAQLATAGHGLLHTKDVVLVDIRDMDSLRAVFRDRRPEVVYHAAALKHLPMLEQYPTEAWQTNVLGTLNVLTAAEEVDVERFINISTDKAANPTSVLGHSKRLAEKLTSWYAETTSKPFVSVRFGNVIGSRGSMLPTFRTLIEQDKDLTLTHPDVTRYFMTIPEACQLVVQAGAIGSPGEVMILDMGEPVKIIDVARRMIQMSGRDVNIKITGLREGEKMHEELIGEGETDVRPFHPKISHARVGSFAPSELDRDSWLVTIGALERAHPTVQTGPGSAEDQAASTAQVPATNRTDQHGVMQGGSTAPSAGPAAADKN